MIVSLYVLGSLASGPSSYEVASPASQELYVFDTNGTHQFTMSLVTGDYKYNFSYRFVCVEMSMCLPWWKKLTFKDFIMKIIHIPHLHSLLKHIIYQEIIHTLYFSFSSFCKSKKYFILAGSWFVLVWLSLKYSPLCLSTLSNEEDVTAVTDSSGNTLRIRRDTNRMPVRVVAPDNQVRWACLEMFHTIFTHTSSLTSVIFWYMAGGGRGNITTIAIMYVNIYWLATGRMWTYNPVPVCCVCRLSG